MDPAAIEITQDELRLLLRALAGPLEPPVTERQMCINLEGRALLARASLGGAPRRRAYMLSQRGWRRLMEMGRAR
jgi:hypothetical protein